MEFDLQFLIGLFCSFLDFTAFTLLSLSIYRVPILMYWKRLLVIQFVFIAIMLVHEQILLNKDFYALSIAGVAIILSTVLLRIPILYSALVWGTGYLLDALLQTVIILAVTATGLLTIEQMQSSPWSKNIMLLSFTFFKFLVVYYLNKKRLGFMFIVNRFRLEKSNIRLKDLFVAITFVSTVSLVQVGIVSFVTNSLNQYLFFVLLSMIVVSLIGMYITYKFNMQEINERFSSLRRR